ncbi:MAG TPA: endonuclease/exonuclease/phosphatase family protein [Bacteroidales bacterium]|nr:endonuclease/exonuclease/phosphatase family protein [Bacteroidales bacterium]HQG35949.1 endonuclease/exonuclease/phosphatase family protein [Bacteroidales bacterium]HQG52987.1 endonuclease/exonuclease/phosphatase family protein [Bacteroidales bacterium]HQJ21384.1 endonuclease/exonuclease/phosphatase family protein [Bacteroidales bacterium]
MRLNKILFSAIFILAFLICAGNKTNETIKVITFNIRYDNPNDGINAWTNRKNLVIEFLKEEKPDLFGLQEALWHQYTAIDSAMEGWSSIGVGRDDGKRKGEMNPLFFNDNRFKMIRSNTFWLSETPDIPGSKGWGANLPRIVTWVELKEIKTGKTLYYFNTHFAHDSDSARVMSAALLLDQVKKIAGNEKFIITGDFNMRPDSRAYYILTGAGKGNPLLVDSYKISQSAPEGPTGSSNGWSDASRGNRIDYIFVRNGMKVNSIKTVVRKQGNVFISDHWPVVAEISLE